MARRGSNTAEAEPEQAVETEATEPEAAASPEPEATETKPAPEPEPEVDLTEFEAAANSAVDESDESTGTVSVEALSKVNEIYRTIEGVKGKNKARAWVDDQMKEALGIPSIQRARAFVAIRDGLSAGTSSGSTKTPADPTTAFVHKIVALQLGVEQLMDSVPEGVADNWSEQADDFKASLADQVASYAAYVADTDEDAEQPDVSPVVRQAFKLSASRASSGGGSTRVAGGPRRDVGKHLDQVFESLASGDYLTVNEIAKSPSSEYGDDRPSPGAVSARLFPKGKEPYAANGVTAVNDGERPRGAQKD